MGNRITPIPRGLCHPERGLGYRLSLDGFAARQEVWRVSSIGIVIRLNPPDSPFTLFVILNEAIAK